MTIGERIKQLRISLHMSQDTLAELVGYQSRATINKIEAGERDIRQSKIVSFATALHTTPAYIMGWSETSESDEDSDLLSKYHALDNYGKGTVNTILNREYDRCTNNSNTTTIYRAARSADHHAAEIVETTKDFSKFPKKKDRI